MFAIKVRRGIVGTGDIYNVYKLFVKQPCLILRNAMKGDCKNDQINDMIIYNVNELLQ